MKSIWKTDSIRKVLGTISVLTAAAAAVLSISLCCGTEAAAASLYAEEAAQVSEQQASQVNFERNYTDGMEQAVITGFDDSGAVLWTVQTASYPGTQLPNCCDVGIENGKYYYVEGGTIITLDLRDGSRIWENPEFGGSTCCHIMDENGTLFICGYYGPDLFVVDRDGHTISKTEKFREGYNWPHQIELQEGILTIWYEQNGESLQVRVSDVAGDAAEAEASQAGAEASPAGAEASPAETEASPVEAEASPAETETSPAEAGTQPAGEPVRLTPLSITASSELEPYHSSVPPYELYTYYASYIDDGSLSTAWNEGVPGDGTGEYLELAYPAGTILTGGVIWPGFYDTEELFYQNNAPTSLEISSGGISSIVELGESAAVWQPDFGGFLFKLDREIVSDGTVRVTILGVRAGNTYDDTCISELYFKGREAAGQESQAAGESQSAQPQQEAVGNAAGMAEGDMQRIFAEQVAEPILYFLYDDYDYDGTYEAMIATEQPGGVYDHIWFMDSSGQISDLTGGREIYGYEFQDNANVRQRYLIDTGTQKFYVWENSAGGSGSLSYVFGVRGGVPYEPAISGTVQSFQKEGEEYVYYGNDFSKGFHEYPRIVLTYDAGSGEFYSHIQ